MKKLEKTVYFIVLLQITGIILNGIFNPYVDTNTFKIGFPYWGVQLYSFFIALSAIIVIKLFIFKKKTINVVEKEDKIEKIVDKWFYWIIFFQACIFTIISVLFISYFKLYPSWDYGIIYNFVVAMGNGEHNFGYFSAYPNNLFFALVLYFISLIFGSELITFEIINIIMIVISLVLLALTANKIIGSKKYAIYIYTSALLFLPFLFYTPIFYSDTFVLPFIMLSLYLLFDRKGNITDSKWSILIATIVLSLGYLLKASLIIYVISLSIILILRMKKWNKVYSVLPFLFIFLFSTAFSTFIDKQEIFSKPYNDVGYPIYHWLAMGQNDNESYGAYSEEDAHFIATLYASEEFTDREKNEILITRAFERITSRSLSENLLFYSKKHAVNWNDSTYFSLRKLKNTPEDPKRIEVLYKGGLGVFIQIYLDLFHQIVYVLIFIGTIMAIKRNKIVPIYTYINLVLIGFAIFFLMWEGRSRYLFPTVLPLILLAGLYACSHSKYKNARIGEE